MTGAVGDRLALGDRLAARALDTVGHALRTGAMQVSLKGAGDLVTDVDLALEAMLTRAIAAAFPDDAVLGEERGGALAGDGFGWLLDPVDGTVNFAHRLGYVCTSIALVRGGEVIAAWIVDPLLAEVFHAGPDGALRIRPDLGATAMAPGAQRVVGIGFSDRHDPALAAAVVAALGAEGIEFRRLGAGALCLAHVAAGRLDAYLEPHMNLWDGAGGLFLARAAGAVTLPYPLTGTGGVVFAAAADIAPRLLDILPFPFSGPPCAGMARPNGGLDCTARSPIPTDPQETRE